MPAVSLTRYPWVIPCGLFLLTLLAYANSFPGAFILDDIHIVQNSGLVLHIDLATIFTSDYWYPLENSGLYRPLTILSFGVNRLLLGGQPWGYHLVNVLLHAVVVVLLWVLLREWQLSRVSAGFAALLFALHPIHTEVVNVMVGRSELLVALFLLCAFLADRHGGKGSSLLVCLSYLLALLSKEHAITFLVMLPILDVFWSGVRGGLKRWRLHVGLLGITIGWLLWRKFGVINPLPPFGLTDDANPLGFVNDMTRVLTALKYQGFYFSKMVLPFGLQSVYSRADLPGYVDTLASVAGLLVIAVLGVLLVLLVIGWRRRHPLAPFGMIYVISFLPTSNLFFPIGTTIAERLAYWPSLWFCIASGLLVAYLLEKSRLRRWVIVVITIYMIWLAGVLFIRNRDYESELTLWTAEVENNPDDYLGWQSVAESLSNLRRDAEAENAYRIMLALAPDYPGGLRSVTQFYDTRGLYEQALPSALRAFSIAQRKGDTLGMAFDGLDVANIMLGLHRCTEGLAYLDGPSLPLRDSLRAVEVRASLLSCLDRDEDAVEFFARIDGEPPQHRIAYQYGLSLMKLGRLPEARIQLEKAVRNEKDAAAWNLLGVVCAQMNDWPAAVAAMERATALDPDNRHYSENLERARRKGVP